jgi:hypothetical protein
MGMNRGTKIKRHLILSSLLWQQKKGYNMKEQILPFFPQFGADLAEMTADCRCIINLVMVS